MFKPRGPHKPTFKPSGVNQFALVRFLEAYQQLIEKNNEDAAFYIEQLVTFFKEDYDCSRPLEFDSQKLGL